MKRIGIFWTGIRAYISTVHPVDRCLIVFTAVLLAYSVYSLFVPEQTAVAGDIDTMVRTSLAAVFGYFLSTNFGVDSSELSMQKRNTFSGFVSQEEAEPEKPEISFASEDPPVVQQNTEPQPSNVPTQEESSSEDPESAPPTASRLQILLAAGIGLICLISLMVLRCFPALAEQGISGSPAATIAQFRDLVSGCIGFLIGYPAHRSL